MLLFDPILMNATRPPFRDESVTIGLSVTYHSWFAIPFSRNERVPIIVPQYLYLDLSKRV
jgi:hypothetical protein